MNNRCFRLIFSKPLGFLIPVAEIATAKRKPGQQQAHSSISLPLIPPAFSLKRIALSLLLAGAPGWAAAEIILDRNFGGTSMGSAANGVPVIEISNPNGSGLSHNRFGQFDISNPGVIFNNSLVNGTSQIGGAVLLNPNLKRTARAILTEVTGNKPSSISGTLEVFGDAADLLIANPNGLTLNGVTTLNSSRLTVSAGHVSVADGSLQFLIDESSGQVLIGADGVNTAGLSYFDVVARSVALQGVIGSENLQTDLNVTAGQGAYDADAHRFTAKQGAQGSGVAIAGSAAGAMHGRYINLISSDSGAGVRHEGLILAAQDIQITADGDIGLKDTGAGGQVQIASTATVTNSGTLDARTGLSITAHDVINRSGALLGSGADVKINAAGNLINEKDATVLAERDMQLRAARQLNNAGALQAKDKLRIDTQDLTNSGAGLVRAKTLSVSVRDLENRDGATFFGSDTARFSLSGSLRNQRGAGMYAQNELTLDVIGAVLNYAATLASTQLTIHAGSLSNVAAAKIVADAGLYIDVSGLALNDNASLSANAIILQAGNLTNQAGAKVLADADVTIKTSGAVRNNAGTIAAGTTLTIGADTRISNSNSGVLAGTTVSLNAADIANTDKAKILGTNIELKAKNSFTSESQASIQAAKDLSVDAQTFSVSLSELIAGNDLALNLGSYLTSGTITSFNTASLSLKNNANLVIDAAFKGPQAAGLGKGSEKG